MYPGIVVYLLHTTSLVIPEEVKIYRSLQRFRYFMSGWVLEVGWKKYSEGGTCIVLVIGDVTQLFFK